MNFVSLFSGCGGLDLGLEQAGFKSLLALDSDANAVRSFQANFPQVPVIQKRIGEVKQEDIRSVLTVKSVDLLAGGPPCPPFSKSRFYRKDKPRALDDPNGWETVEGYLRVLEWLRPRAFILENVKGLAYKVHSSALDHILNTAKRLGYTTTVGVLNAADYGVPQIRERCFVLGSVSGQVSLPEKTHSQDGGLLTHEWLTAGQVLSDIDTEENASDEGHFAGGQHHNLLKEIPPGDNYLFLTAKRGHPHPSFEWRKRYWSFLLKLSPDMPSWTIQARRSNNMGPFHWRNRILRIEEVKRLQAFPDYFQLHGTVEQQWRQIGNAVPPLLAKHVGRAILRHLEKQHEEAA